MYPSHHRHLQSTLMWLQGAVYLTFVMSIEGILHFMLLLQLIAVEMKGRKMPPRLVLTLHPEI